MAREEPQTDPAAAPERPAHQQEPDDTPPPSMPPQAPAALGGMGSTGPVTVVRKKT